MTDAAVPSTRTPRLAPRGLGAGLGLWLASLSLAQPASPRPLEITALVALGDPSGRNWLGRPSVPGHRFRLGGTAPASAQSVCVYNQQAPAAGVQCRPPAALEAGELPLTLAVGGQSRVLLWALDAGGSVLGTARLELDSDAIPPLLPSELRTGEPWGGRLRVSGTAEPSAQRVVLKVEGVSETPADRPEGDAQVAALLEGEACANARVLVVVPRTQSHRIIDGPSIRNWVRPCPGLRIPFRAAETTPGLSTGQ
jgi:hypothetical protein